MPLLPQTRNLLATNDLDAVEIRMDRLVVEIQDTVGSAVEHLDMLKGCKTRIHKVREKAAARRNHEASS